MAWVIINNRLTNTEFIDIPESSMAKPYPKALWRIENGKLTSGLFADIPTSAMQKPYPKALWRIDSDYNNGIPYNELLPNIPITRKIGAFKDAESLMHAEIPYSVKKIGEYAFAGTQLTKVTIAEDCEYYPTSFPEDCEIYFYGGGGAYAPLADPDGAQLIDGECARIYVRSDE